MAVDADSTPLHDFYLRANNPPLSGVNMMSQARAASSWAESRFAVNGGFTYVQNAAPNGPVAWIFFDMLHRAVRWSEDCSALRKLAVDLCESMLSTLAGRPVFGMAYRFLDTAHPMWTALHPDGVAGVDNFLVNISANKMTYKVFRVPPPLSRIACDRWPCTYSTLNPADNSTEAWFTVGQLLMPHTGGEWLKELAGNPFAPLRQRAIAYRAAYEALRKHGAPRLPDSEDPADLELARSTPSEVFVLLSSIEGPSQPLHPEAGPWTRKLQGGWVEAAHWTTGRWGHFHTHMRPRYQPAIGHMHVGVMYTYDNKGIMAKTTDHYDWDLAVRFAGNREHVFYASGWGPDQRALDPEQLKSDWQDPPALGRVVAYAPGVIHAGLSKDEFLRAAEELARVSLALGAVAAWPAAPCDADWCEWMGFVDRACLASPPRPGDTGRGLLALELRQLLKWLPPRQKTHTLTLAGDGPAAVTPPPPGASSAFLPVSSADLLQLNAERLLQLRPHPELLWLDRLVAVEGLGGAAAERLGRWTQGCRALRYRNAGLGASLGF
ncbi:hypothetical protein HYH03_016495 [Edaphochlamys debaryana]|uniref:Uncharacterized protein n=1 Tax=Edaphochlamys debaryana TaxID=47281 RepID=A0A835XL27_9CHLO|nr:hypothetical protein HYH03_016495 [Edaphochlamys debaryana]|eukprot:KAG2484748.1 hypothetical protein HYH03_016495 [Edaphochlamys debaryana]